MVLDTYGDEQLAADVCILRSYATHAASDSHTHSSFGDLGGLGHNLWRSPFESACLKGTCDAAQLARLCHLWEALEYDDVVDFIHGYRVT